MGKIKMKFKIIDIFAARVQTLVSILLFLGLTAHSAPSFEVASGSVFTIYASDTSSGQDFSGCPKAYYILGVNGKAVKKNLTVLTKTYPSDRVLCKMSTVPATGTADLYIVPPVKGKPGSPELVSSDFKIMPLSISSISPADVCSGMLVTVSGAFFGMQKPKISMSFLDPISGKTVKKNCAIKTPLAFPDENGKEGKSCMNLETGESRLVFLVPSKAPLALWTLKLDNKISGSSGAIESFPPQISSISPNFGSSGDEITIEGNFFGQPVPSVCVDYNVSSSETKSKKCAIKTPLEYPDAAGHGGKSCMELGTGASRLKFIVPSGLPSGTSLVKVINSAGESGISFDLTYHISGSVSRDIMKDVQLNLSKDGTPVSSVYSAADGSFKINGLVNGDYILTAEKSGYFFFPSQYEIELNGKNSTGRNFVATAMGTYIVIDVSGGPTALEYPRYFYTPENAPTGIYSDDEYKGNLIAFRKVENQASATFSMGSPADEIGKMSNETQHQVTITKNYYAAVFETTQAQYWNVTGNSPSYYQGAFMPVEQVSWNDVRGGDWPGDPSGSGIPLAGSFMGLLSSKSGLGCDLPTEAEWEQFCRSGTGTALNIGSNLSSAEKDEAAGTAAWYMYNAENGQHSPVGGKIPNYKGFFDMHGNVWELCLDWYEKNLGSSPQTDPLGSALGSTRSVRGGAWINNAGSVRSARRSSFGPQDFQNYCGFRTIVKAYGISGSISGTVAASVKISLESDLITASATSSSAGAYAFYGMPKGVYTLTPSVTGYVFDPPSAQVEIEDSDQSAVNFSSSGMKFTISGTIDGAVKEGVLLTASGTAYATATSDANGAYTITGLISGNYTVAPSKSGYSFSPASKDLSIYGSSIANIDFSSQSQ